MNTKELLKLHDDTCKACRVIMQKKNSDYTGGKGATDPFANFNASKDTGHPPCAGFTPSCNRQNKTNLFVH